MVKLAFGDYVREHIFKQGMNSASLCDARMVTPHLASAYEVDHGKLLNAWAHARRKAAPALSRYPLLIAITYFRAISGEVWLR
jgi:hypothetical protein